MVERYGVEDAVKVAMVERNGREDAGEGCDG